MTGLTSRERIRRTLEGRLPDRIAMVDICFWPETVERWHQEGLPQDESPAEHFGLDAISTAGLDCSLRLEVEVLEECDEWKIERDSNGTVHKHWKTRTATPCEIDNLIKSRDDWLSCRDRLEPTADRIPQDATKLLDSAHSESRFCTLDPCEPVWWTLRTLGMERALVTLATDPAWFEEMVAAQTELSLELCRMMIAQGPKPDGVWFFSDLCYRNGMLFSPALYRSMMLPYHRRFADLCHANDMFLLLHCCGDVRQLVPHLIDAGFDAIQPLEARAGNDVRQLKPLYGDRITLFGNMDMDVYATGDLDAVRHEVLSKLEAAMPGGRYIYHSDHSVPPTVSFATYSYAHELLCEYGRY